MAAALCHICLNYYTRKTQKIGEGWTGTYDQHRKHRRRRRKHVTRIQGRKMQLNAVFLTGMLVFMALDFPQWQRQKWNIPSKQNYPIPQIQSDALALQHRTLLTDYDKLFSPLYNILHLCRLFFVISHLIASLIYFPNHLGWLQIPHYFPRFCFSGLALWVCGTSNDNNNHSSSIINNTFVGLEIMTGNHSGLEVHWLHFFFPGTE